METTAAPVPLHTQKLAVLRAHQLLAKYYPAIITRGGATEERAAAHLLALEAALETLDRADRGIDIRPNLLKAFPSKEEEKAA